MKNLVLFIIVLFSINSVNSQKKQNKDIEAIKKMCGCYEVTYNFAETFENKNFWRSGTGSFS